MRVCFVLSIFALLFVLAVPSVSQQPIQHAFLWSRTSGMQDLGVRSQQLWSAVKFLRGSGGLLCNDPPAMSGLSVDSEHRHAGHRNAGVAPIARFRHQCAGELALAVRPQTGTFFCLDGDRRHEGYWKLGRSASEAMAVNITVTWLETL